MPEIWDVYDGNRVKTGKTVLRGERRQPDEYCLGMHAWVRNSRGEWLLSRRAAEKTFAGYWECTGGGVVAGETTLQSAAREVREELGVRVNMDTARLFRTCKKESENGGSFLDVWVFFCDWAIEDIVLQDGETCDAMWANKEEILRMRADGRLLPPEHYPYLEELLDAEWTDII